VHTRGDDVDSDEEEDGSVPFLWFLMVHD